MAPPLFYLVLTLLISLSFACPSDSPKQLRFVAQLSVSGCALFVHDTGPKHAPHFEVEPLMCVRESLRYLIPRFDPVTMHTYVSVPVTLRDDSVLEEARRQLEHLSPNSTISFARVRDIRVRSDASSLIQTLGFVWNPDESVGYLRLGCIKGTEDCSMERVKKYIFESSSSRLVTFNSFKSSKWVKLFKPSPSAQIAASLSLHSVSVSAHLDLNNSSALLNYSLQIQNTSFIDPGLYTTRYACLPSCRHLRFVRSLRLSNCTARVHQRLDAKGHFLIEPLLCHNITTMSNNITSVMYDISRDMYYLKLDIVLIDQITLDVVRSQLADLSPLSVSFMRVWRSEISVSTVLRNQYDIGRLMVSDDGRSGVVQVYSRTENDCISLRSRLLRNPMNFWIHVGIKLSSIAKPRNCQLNTVQILYPWTLNETANADLISQTETENRMGEELMLQTTILPKLSTTTRPVKKLSKTRTLMMQRLRGHVSFARSWAEYEQGFGDEVDFWIGLRTISLLSSLKPMTLRVEMEIWDGDEVFVEYTGFTVGNSSTNYYMTYTGTRNAQYMGLGMQSNISFSTMDRDNDGWLGTECSQTLGGNGGFWFGSFCGGAFPTGTYPTTGSPDSGEMKWWYSFSYKSLRRIRMYLS